jgi:hypothetical protein
MSKQMLIQIVPALRPRNDGAGEYALNLAKELRHSYGIQSRFIVCDPEREGSSRIEDFVIQRLRLRSEAGIWSLLATAKNQHAPVLLHYCPYGYHRQAVPIWLYRGIKSWLDENGGLDGGKDKQFYTVFYEALLLSAKFWKKEFFLRIPQQWLMEQIHRQSKISMTSSRYMQTFFDDIDPHKTLLLPRPRNVSPWDEQNTSWKQIGLQYYNVLFEKLTDLNKGNRLDQTPIEQIKGRITSKYNPVPQAVNSRMPLRSRPA